MLEPEDSFNPDLGLMPSKYEATKALLIGVASKGALLDKCQEYLQELADLADTFGVDVVKIQPAICRKFDAALFLPEGKLTEVAELASQTGANLIIFDEPISPAQQRNLEKFFKLPVMDRTELILEIFAQRAHTKEAKIQVQLAKLEYEFPRLKRMWSHLSRQRASGGYLKGEGEKQLELDKRMLKVKLQRLQSELKEVVKARAVQSSARQKKGLPTFAIIGYTNAGKSTLLKALTGADVLVEDKLFATLDRTTRKFMLPNNQPILLSDTVGFIRKLPHLLVAAFKSTLEAAMQDDVLLHVIDASHPQALDQAQTTFALLKELGIERKEGVITVLNKVDQCADPSQVMRLKLAYPRCVAISAKTLEGFDELIQLMVDALAHLRRDLKLKIPQSQYALVSFLHEKAQVLFEEYEDNDVLMQVQVPVPFVHKCLPFLNEEMEEAEE
jgi:GTP-binding protein HflX